jgi:hypothetical protein
MSSGIHFKKTVKRITNFSRWLVCETIRSTLQDVDARIKSKKKEQLTSEMLKNILDASVKSAVSHLGVLQEYQKYAVSCSAYFDKCDTAHAILVPQAIHNAQIKRMEKWTQRLRSLLTSLIIPSTAGGIAMMNVSTVRQHLQALLNSGLCENPITNMGKGLPKASNNRKGKDPTSSKEKKQTTVPVGKKGNNKNKARKAGNKKTQRVKRVAGGKRR